MRILKLLLPLLEHDLLRIELILHGLQLFLHQFLSLLELHQRLCRHLRLAHVLLVGLFLANGDQDRVEGGEELGDYVALGLAQRLGVVGFHQVVDVLCQGFLLALVCSRLKLLHQRHRQVLQQLDVTHLGQLLVDLDDVPLL